METLGKSERNLNTSTQVYESSYLMDTRMKPSNIFKKWNTYNQNVRHWKLLPILLELHKTENMRLSIESILIVQI